MKKNSFSSFFSKFGFLLNVCFGGTLLIVYLSVFIPPDSFWPAAFFGLLYPYLLLVNLAFVVFYALLKSKKFIFSFLVILLGYQHFLNFVQPVPTFATSTGGIKVITFNVHYFAGDREKKPKNSTDILSYLKKMDADIVCLQEARLFKTGKLSPDGIREGLPGIRNYQLAHSISYGGPMTLSKFPIIRMGEIRFEHSANMVLFSDMVTREKDTVRVYNCHFQSYRITPEDYSITDPERTGSNEQQLMEARQISRKMILAFSIRARQSRIVAEHIRKCLYPVIVCGDFNDTPVSYTYHILGKQLKDTFVEAGVGISNTFNGISPFLRIDYILCSPFFKVASYQRDLVDLSDHSPVVAVIRKNKTK